MKGSDTGPGVECLVGFYRHQSTGGKMKVRIFSECSGCRKCNSRAIVLKGVDVLQRAGPVSEGVCSVR